jgi:acyl carrier protein
MTSAEQVFDVVRKHVIDTLEDLDEAQITGDKSLKDLGANSLDIVEIVSGAMRELKVKVPRSELGKLENVGQLVDLLHRVVNERDA